MPTASDYGPPPRSEATSVQGRDRRISPGCAGRNCSPLIHSIRPSKICSAPSRPPARWWADALCPRTPDDRAPPVRSPIVRGRADGRRPHPHHPGRLRSTAQRLFHLARHARHPERSRVTHGQSAEAALINIGVLGTDGTKVNDFARAGVVDQRETGGRGGRRGFDRRRTSARAWGHEHDPGSRSHLPPASDHHPAGPARAGAHVGAGQGGPEANPAGVPAGRAQLHGRDQPGRAHPLQPGRIHPLRAPVRGAPGLDAGDHHRVDPGVRGRRRGGESRCGARAGPGQYLSSGPRGGRRGPADLPHRRLPDRRLRRARDAPGRREQPAGGRRGHRCGHRHRRAADPGQLLRRAGAALRPPLRARPTDHRAHRSHGRPVRGA